MKSKSNQCLLDVLNGHATQRMPIWFMRQAGRYLPEYRELRAKAGDFLSLCHNPEWAAEVTLQPLRRFDFDAAIIFSDILLIADVLGLGLYFAQGEGPGFRQTIRSMGDLAYLQPVETITEKLQYVYDALAIVREKLPKEKTLIGFAGSPWTVACYVVEGGGSKTFSHIKRQVYGEPELIKSLLDTLTQATILHLKAQVKAGAEVLMLFDTWGGVLGPAVYQQYSYHYLERIVHALKHDDETAHIPVILFSKQAPYAIPLFAKSGCDGIGLDWTIPVAEARKIVGPNMVLQGNLDPSILYASPSVIEKHVNMLLEEINGTPHIVNLGHGIYPDVPPEHVEIVINTVRHFS